jgi:hypothetical protein
VRAAALPLVDFRHPMTFRSRGISAPFTTPLLAGTRIRESKHKGIELVVPNPSGRRGVYILNWPGVRGLGNPTVHDTMLFRRCCRLEVIEPARIRDAALEVACEGHAGRAAAAAAGAAIARDRSESVRAHFVLVTGLVAQVDPNRPDVTTLADRATDLDRKDSAVLQRIATSLRRSAADLATSLTTIGDLFAPLGVSLADRDARIPRLLGRLEETESDLSRWLSADPTNDIGGLGEAIAAAMRTAGETGTAVLQTTRSALADPMTLLRRWSANPASVSAQANRCDWLLDGWPRVCLLWLSANTIASRLAALLEMAPLVPILPREVLEWSDTIFPPETMTEACRVTSHEEGWRTGGSAFALIERNEKLLAMGA